MRFCGPAEISTISPVVDWVMEAAKKTGCVRGKEFEIETALREALANAVLHGCQNNPLKKIEMWVVCHEASGVLIVVRDPGPGFDPAKIPSPTQGLNIFSQHGRGIFLINQLMDDVRFARGGTEIRMRKR